MRIIRSVISDKGFVTRGTDGIPAATYRVARSRGYMPAGLPPSLIVRQRLVELLDRVVRQPPVAIGDPNQIRALP